MKFQQTKEKNQKIKHRIFEILHEEFQHNHDRFGHFMVRFITILIALNVLAVILSSIESIEQKFEEELWIFELISIIIFSMEYFSEVWTSNLNPKYIGPIKGRIKYILSPMAIIDLLAILPFYAPFLFPFDLRFLRILRVFRIFHLFTLGHYSEAFEVIEKILHEKKEALIMTGFIGLLIILTSSMLIYLFEHDAQHETFSDLFFTIYWVSITLAGINHGNIHAITPGGEIIATIIEILGIMFFILPTGIIASGFLSHISHEKPRQKKPQTCPHCKKKFVFTPESKPVVIDSEKVKTINPIQRPYKKLQKRTYELLNDRDSDNKVGIFITTFLVILIIVNVLMTMLETLEDFYSKYSVYLYYFDLFSIIIFIIEYISRVWSCPFDENETYHSPIKGRILYVLSPLAIIDLLAILPFFLPMFFVIDLRFLRIIRLIRFFRIFKFERYSTSLENMRGVFSEKKEALLVSVFIWLIFWIFVSSIIYYAEHEVQPENFTSIPMTLWWSLIVMSKVHTTDTIPLTAIGQIFSVVQGFLTMSLLALPTGIIGAGFVEHIEHEQISVICPYCEKETNILRKPNEKKE